MWEIVTTERFDQWFLSQDESAQEALLVGIFKLKEFGPELGRPLVDTLKNTGKFKNLKELRVQHHGMPLRIFFAFDPSRTSVLLCAGNKTGNKLFYEKMLPVAESEYVDYLNNLEANHGKATG